MTRRHEGVCSGTVKVVEIRKLEACPGVMSQIDGAIAPKRSLHDMSS